MSDLHEIDPRLVEERLAATRIRGRRRLKKLWTLAGSGLVILVAAILVPTLGGSDTPTAHGPQGGSVLASLRIPDSYSSACANEPGVCLENARGQVPALLKRSLHFPVVKQGASCPSSPGAAVDKYTSYFVGTALGSGPVRVAIGNRGDLRVGRAQLGTTGVRGWFALETLWFAMPYYDGPFVVRGERLGGSGTIDVDGSATDPSPLVVPPGPTANTHDGIRVAPVSTWVTSPGCYAWQVDGLSFSYVIVVNASP